ncbi:hypothetical protein [Streptomyces dysideae]|uniref:hypothetical protein n=1 Tax=Streptomyces dysideae TaxID=909626 RepID=UPI00131E7829|nr:hypothetical protein [Streptomyces dysideae]
MPQRDTSKGELISLILAIAALSAGAALVIANAATTTEASGFVVTILAAIGWGAHRRK